MLQFYNVTFYIQILQMQTSPDQFLMFLVKVKAVLLFLITSGVLFHSMLPLNDIEFRDAGAIAGQGGPTGKKGH